MLTRLPSLKVVGLHPAAVAAAKRARPSAAARCERCGDVVEGTLNGRCRACSDAARWMSPDARADLDRLKSPTTAQLRARLGGLQDRLGEIIAKDAARAFILNAAEVSGDHLALLDDAEVAEETRRVACAAVGAAADLGIDGPYIYWFEASDGWNGFAPADGGVVLLNVDLDGAPLVRTCAHEVAHLAGHGHPDANDYAGSFAARHAQEIVNAR